MCPGSLCLHHIRISECIIHTLETTMNSHNPFPVRAMKAHLALNVRSISQSIDFYRALLGIEPVKVRDDYAKFDVENPPLNLTLNQRESPGHGTLSHLGIQVASTAEVI